MNSPQLTIPQANAFCPRCSCEYQIRNLSVMKIVVILIVWVISVLVIYMAFLACLEPLLTRRGPGSGSYSEHHDDDDEEEEDDDVDPVAGGGGGEASLTRNYGTSVINRLDDQQARWKRQVREQRKNIYDRHSMLN